MPISNLQIAYIYSNGSYRYGTAYESNYDNSNGTIYATQKEY